ncbi:MAG: integrase, partial [Desulfobacterales bacterium]|nr:integrase [Desulfobacterales bacterium]
MPYWNKPRKKWIGQVVFNGKKYQSQHESEQAARRWEQKKKTLLEVESGKVALTGTVSLVDLAERYLDYAESRFTRKTYNEKKLAFRMLFGSVNADLDASLLHQGDVLEHLRQQHEERSGCSANKDRKNLIAAWNWAVRYIPDFPESNPFMTDRFPEIHSPRYVPSEEDFWKVYDVAESD